MSGSPHQLDRTIARNTGFRSFADLLDSSPHYRPSLDMSQQWARDVADAYDAAMAARGDERRAYRYGVDKRTGLQKAKAAIKAARKGCKAEVRRIAPECKFMRGRGVILWAIDAQGDRLNGSSYHEFKAWRDVLELVRRYPDTVKIIAEGGINFAETLADLDECYYWEHWEATVWEK